MKSLGKAVMWRELGGINESIQLKLQEERKKEWQKICREMRSQ